MRLADLAAEFPRDAVHWRSQTLTRNGDKALALAYLDARDVMDRLDEVCGPENWQSEITETAKGRVICRLGIRIGDQWVWKSDGAGDTAVEGEKGGISDSLKRAAVLWGIGRYLYRMDAVWAPCETYEKNGKRYFSKWKGSPWECVRGGSRPEPEKKAEKTPAEKYDWFKQVIESKSDAAAIDVFWGYPKFKAHFDSMSPEYQAKLQAVYDARKAELAEPTADEMLRAG